MYDTHTPAEWASMVCLATSVYAGLSVPYFVFVDADLADFDPRPAVSRLVESGSVDRLLIAVAGAKFDARQGIAEARESAVTAWQLAALSLRDAAMTTLALLALLFPATGGTR